jgi:hypothetical protein
MKDAKGLNDLKKVSDALVKGPTHQIIDPLKKGKK